MEVHETTRRQWPVRKALAGAILFGTIVVCANAWSLQLSSFLHAKEIVAYAGLLGLALFAKEPTLKSFAILWPLWLLLAIGALVHLMAVPAQAPDYVVRAQLRFGVLLILAMYADEIIEDEPWRERLVSALVVSAAVGGGLAVAQYAGVLESLFPSFGGRTHRAYSVFGNADLLGGYMAMVLPFTMDRMLRSAPFSPINTLATVVILAALLVSGCRSAWAAAIVGAITVFLLSKPSRRRALSVTAVVLAAIVVAVVLVPEATVERARAAFGARDTGWHARLWFWDGTRRMIRDHPVIGVGPGNFAYWSPSYLAEALWAPGGEHHMHDQRHARNAHSAPLQLAAEYGLVGVAVCGLMASRLFRARGPALGGLLAFCVFSLANSAGHSPPHALAALLCLLLSRYGDRTARALAAAPSPARGLAFVSAIYAMLTLSCPSAWLRQSAELVETRGAIEEAPEWIAGKIDHPLTYGPFAPGAWAVPELRYYEGLVLWDVGREDAAYTSIEKSLDGLDTGEVYLVLGALELRKGNRLEAASWLEQCVYRWPGNEQAWRLLYQASDEPQRARVRRWMQRWLAPDRIEDITGRGDAEVNQ